MLKRSHNSGPPPTRSAMRRRSCRWNGGVDSDRLRPPDPTRLRAPKSGGGRRVCWWFWVYREKAGRLRGVLGKRFMMPAAIPVALAPTGEPEKEPDEANPKDDPADAPEAKIRYAG